MVYSRHYEYPSTLWEHGISNPFTAAAISQAFTNDLETRGSGPIYNAIEAFMLSAAKTAENENHSTRGSIEAPNSSVYVTPPPSLASRKAEVSRKKDPSIPAGLSPTPASSGPAAWLLKNENENSKYLITKTADPQQPPVPHANNPTNVEEICKTKQNIAPGYFLGPEGVEFRVPDFFRNSNEYRQPYYRPLGFDENQTTGNYNSIEPYSSGRGMLAMDGSPYLPVFFSSQLTNIPIDSAEAIAYLNSYCRCFMLSDTKKSQIAEALFDTNHRTSSLDDCIFQIIDSMSSERLRDTDGYFLYPHLLDQVDDRLVPAPTYVAQWREEIELATDHLRMLSNVAYATILSRNRVIIVWEALVMYRDEWMASMFNDSDRPDWETTPGLMADLKEYEAFNREMQRSIRHIEDDLVMVGRLENNINHFRLSVMKAKEKFEEMEWYFKLHKLEA